MREVLTSAQDPLAVLVEIAANTDVDVNVRVQAATAACPFMFPRLSAAVVTTAPPSARDDAAGLVERLMTRFARLAPPMHTIDGTATATEPEPQPLAAG